MTRGWKALMLGAGGVAGLLGLPLAGVWLKGEQVGAYLEFPPITRAVEQPPFSWPVFVVLAVVILSAVLPFDLRVIRSRRALPREAPAGRPFPRWGWAGLAVLAGGWYLAWTRHAGWAPFQLHTFTMIWAGYIVGVNAWLFRRTGRCLLTHRPGYLAALFVASAAFWWFFEYLNRFVQNWRYTGIEGLGGLAYFMRATLPFSTVLPAVMSTWALLRTMPKAGAGLDGFAALRIRRPVLAAWLTLGLASAGLLGVGVRPDLFFPLVWVAPLLLLTASQVLLGMPTVFAPLAGGRWRDVYLYAVAGLVCGFFWELWNFGSVARWEYMVPYVGRFKLFEMPVLGYAGYIPFGLECAVAAGLIEARRAPCSRFVNKAG